MGFVGSLFSGNKGLGWEAGSAPLVQVANQQQGQQAYDQTQSALAQQNAFIQALQAQNGIGNQSSVYNQLQGVANGTGPNPAQAQLNQATGQNVANQAALMAGQRGSGANAGLIARQAAQQGANTQQQAVGQGAALQAQQSLGALGQLSGVAGQQVAQQQQAIGNANQFAQGNQQNVYNALGQQNNANVTMQSNVNTANAGINQAIAGQQGNILNKATGAVGSVLGLKMASGGQVPMSNVGRHLKGLGMASGGQVPLMLSPGEKHISKEEAVKVADGKESVKAAGKTVPGKPDGKKDSLKNDKVAASGNEGDFIIPNSIMQSKDAEKKAAEFVRAHLSMRKK